jgi:hypothetical protein
MHDLRRLNQLIETATALVNAKQLDYDTRGLILELTDTIESFKARVAVQDGRVVQASLTERRYRDLKERHLELEKGVVRWKRSWGFALRIFFTSFCRFYR